MEFDKTKVYTALNADELKPGDKVIVANNIGQLINKVKQDYPVGEINGYANGYKERRFLVNDGFSYALAYLVERKENCTNCAFNITPECDKSEWKEEAVKVFKCGEYMPKTEMPELIPLGNGQYAEGKHYRPFKDTDELIKVWEQKFGKVLVSGIELTMPHIWVRRKGANTKGQLITEFGDDWGVGVGRGEAYNMTDLWVHFTFLDGSPCGVEE